MPSPTHETLSVILAAQTGGGWSRSYYFVVALHYDIAITIWSIVAMVFWKRMFHRWVYTDQDYTDEDSPEKIRHAELSRSIFRHVEHIIEVNKHVPSASKL